MIADITVVIVFYHGLDDLLQCLLALHRQTHQPKKVLIVDNSPEGLCGKIACSDKVIVLRSGTNMGFAAGNNWAIREADTKLVFTLNADAFPKENCLEELAKATEKHPECGAFGCVQLQAEDERFLDGLGDFYHLSGLMWRRGYGQLASKFQIDDGPISSPCGAAALYRKSVFDAVGGFDEDFFCYCEDVDLGLRIWSHGWSCRLVADAVVLHKGGGSTAKQSDFAVYHGHRNLVWVFVKNMPGLTFFAFLPLHILMNIQSYRAIYRRGQRDAIRRAKLDAYGGIRKFLDKRRKVASNRRISCWALLLSMNFSVPPEPWRPSLMRQLLKARIKIRRRLSRVGPGT